MIPHSIIEDLKHRCDIVDVISSYVPLKRAGSNLHGLCPFHSEKSPSFTVFTTGEPHFYCFGCGAGGDVISFTMRMENLDYRAALEFLAKRAGITLPDDSRDTTRDVGRKRVLEMNLCAARFFRDCLFDEKLGAEARAYLEKRALSSAVAKRFGLGYAPPSFGVLHDHLRKNGFTDEEMITGYCCARSQKGNVYDIFRGRLMFPLIDVTGNIIAFGGRVLDDSKPKYLNSSDTPAFKKSRNLFALNFAKSHADTRLILCEGYMDVITLHAAGFENAIATLGTAITPDHARIIKKYTSSVVLAYDSDGAGQTATNKALRILADAGVDAKVIKMDGAKDPDEYIKKFGAQKFAALLDESRTRFDFKLDNIFAEYNINVPEEKIKAAAAIAGEISYVYSGVEREIYTAKAASLLGIDPKNLKNDVDAAIRRRARKEKKDRPGELYRAGMGISDRVNPDFARHPKEARFEEMVLGLVFLRKEYLTRAVDGVPLTSDDFVTALGRRLFETVQACEADGGFDMGMLSESFTLDEVSRATYMRQSRENLSDNGPEVFDGTVRALREGNERAKQMDDADGVFDLIRKKRDALKNNAPQNPT
ncbi:MAG: DNA primase [Clostridia bacterium]|nr:DNA primase [Clostridia bacterium]